jgi:hypothetical protein
MLMMKKPNNLEFEPVHPKNVLLAPVVQEIFCLLHFLFFTDENQSPRIIVLSFPRYCRYRAILKRLEDVEDVWLRNTLIQHLCGFAATTPNTRIMFCKDTFDYPELETHELLCNHLAPKFSGRPRTRRKKGYSESVSYSRKGDSEESAGEGSDSDASLGSSATKVSASTF